MGNTSQQSPLNAAKPGRRSGAAARLPAIAAETLRTRERSYRLQCVETIISISRAYTATCTTLQPIYQLPRSTHFSDQIKPSLFTTDDD